MVSWSTSPHIWARRAAWGPMGYHQVTLCPGRHLQKALCWGPGRRWAVIVFEGGRGSTGQVKARRMDYTRVTGVGAPLLGVRGVFVIRPRPIQTQPVKNAIPSPQAIRSRMGHEKIEQEKFVFPDPRAGVTSGESGGDPLKMVKVAFIFPGQITSQSIRHGHVEALPSNIPRPAPFSTKRTRSGWGLLDLWPKHL